MRSRNLIASTIALLALAGGAIGLTAARRGPSVERVDFEKVVRATTPAFDARLAPVSDADVKEFRIPIKDATLEIAKGVTYQGWTFGGTVPGPALRVRVGDQVRITVVNESPMPHSIDFHAARGGVPQARRLARARQRAPRRGRGRRGGSTAEVANVRESPSACGHSPHRTSSVR